jgi:hypothetical protein
LKNFLKETGHTYEKGSGHILNGSGEKVALQDLVSSYNTRKVASNTVHDSVFQFARNQGAGPTINATTVADSKLDNTLSYLRSNNVQQVIHNNKWKIKKYCDHQF